MKRLSFNDLEGICEQEGCRFNDLFLIGEEVFVMIDAEDWRFPASYQPLRLEDQSMREALPEFLRRLDATELPSMAKFEATVRYRSTLHAEFERLKYQLHDVLTEYVGVSPEEDDFYLDLETMGDAEVYLLSTDLSRVDDEMVARIRAAISAGGYELKWSVRVSTEEGGPHVLAIFQDRVISTENGLVEYDEPSVLTEYVWSQCYGEMTDLERAGQKAVHARSKAAASDSDRMRRMILDKWGGGNDPAVVAALAQGEDAFRIALRDRVLRDHPEVVKRCRKCDRVLRTPRARQCRWCFDSWHER
jgi:hypothetical protein